MARESMTAISRSLRRPASWLALGLIACGGRPGATGERAQPAAPSRIIPLTDAIVLETAGPQPADTTVTFVTGRPRVIILRHGPPENVVFAELDFPAGSFATDSGREVRVEVRPRPGVYGLDIATSVPLAEGASVVFKYARYFAAPARARAVYGSDAAYERALAVGQVRADSLPALLPSTRPASDVVRAPLLQAGTYLVAAPR
jgi:hypothetical protein